MEILEDTNPFVMDGEKPDAAQVQANSPIKIEALKELALTLLKEVEALEDTRQAEHNDKGNICLSAEVRRFECDLIRWALVRTNGHQRRAARLLNIKVTTLNAKIKRYGIIPDMPVINLLDMQFDSPRGLG
ncbi:MAG TPA: helix-turn-helix domain-containing protein [Pyrinomonadaceae bacterium]|jgi:transcriptional regulator with GAF, ATPase, and Fis domain